MDQEKYQTYSEPRSGVLVLVIKGPTERDLGHYECEVRRPPHHQHPHSEWWVVNIRPVKPFETVPVIKRGTNEIKVHLIELN